MELFSPPRKKFLFWGGGGGMKLSDSKIKKFLIFPEMEPYTFQPSSKKKKIHPEKIPGTSGNKNPEKTCYIFSKESCPYISGNRKPENILCISGNGTFLYFLKKPPNSQEMKLLSYFRKEIFRTLA